jgi:threonine/homoserine/homoserine lactone efflux protein
MSNFGELLAFGITAGLALAIPLGPMALLLIDTTLRSGWRTGSAGAFAMASVDTLYALTVFLASASVMVFLDTWGLALSLVGALILLALGAQTVGGAFANRMRGASPAASGAYRLSPAQTFGKFVAATLLNPPTALYFLAIAPSLSGLAEGEPWLGAVAFATGVFLGSVVWQQSIALASAAIRGLTTEQIRFWLSLAGGTMIILLAAALAARALTTG